MLVLVMSRKVFAILWGTILLGKRRAFLSLKVESKLASIRLERFLVCF